MENKENNSTIKLVIGVIAVIGIALGIYFTSGSSSSNKKNTSDTHAVFSDEQTKAIEEIVVKVAREKTDVFMKAINDGMQMQQEKSARDLEKNATAEKDTFAKNAIVWGNAKAALQVYVMIDPMCPHCHDFMRTAIETVEKSSDVSFTLVVAPILGPNSVAVSKVMLASATQSADKTKTLMRKFVDKVNDLTREKLIALIKEAGIDVAQFIKDEESAAIQKKLEENVVLIEKLKIPGVPTVFIQNKDGSLFAAPPLKTDAYLKLVKRIKAGEDISKPGDDKAEEPAKEAPKVEEPVKETPKAEEAKKEVSKPAETKKDSKKESASKKKAEDKKKN
ncbi:MAG: DsbA family protein [Candidatus Paracaedibacteraceae bacterium]|nr:DsbA family protein [Candidatus Paracaedibacteraceae bacterium]